MLSVFAVFDSKSEQYLQPFFSPTAAAATRAMSAAVADPSHDFNRFAEDYTLFAIGTWDPETGCLEGFAPAAVVGAWVLKASQLSAQPSSPFVLKGDGDAR